MFSRVNGAVHTAEHAADTAAVRAAMGSAATQRTSAIGPLRAHAAAQRRPTLFTPGRRDLVAQRRTQRDASMGPALFTRENPRVNGPLLRGQRASMGPALFTRENTHSPDGERSYPLRFNGARAVHAGKRLKTRGEVEEISLLQWGPRCSHGKTSIDPSGKRILRRFNGARVVHAGKRPMRILHIHHPNCRLQWGPRCSRGKTAVLLARPHDPGTASMGPALFTRENFSTKADVIKPVLLQWGPRCSRGKTTYDPPLGRVNQWLQWGPRCSRGKTG